MQIDSVASSFDAVICSVHFSLQLSLARSKLTIALTQTENVFSLAKSFLRSVFFCFHLIDLIWICKQGEGFSPHAIVNMQSHFILPTISIELNNICYLCLFVLRLTDWQPPFVSFPCRSKRKAWKWETRTVWITCQCSIRSDIKRNFFDTLKYRTRVNTINNKAFMRQTWTSVSSTSIRNSTRR